MNITFEKASSQYQATIFNWLSEPHMQEHWDNSQEHKDDIINFINGRREPSNYFEGIFTYWIGFKDKTPFALILTAQVIPKSDDPQAWKDNLSKTGRTYSLDFGIGNKDFIGKGLAAETLSKFTEFFKAHVDMNADTFYIDPDENNPRAKHVYEKAGFKLVGHLPNENRYWEFPSGGEVSHLMVKKV